MEENLNIISQFADTIANTLKHFVGLCREDKRRRESEQSEFAQLQNQLIKERKKRMELEEMLRQRVGQADPSLTDVINNYEEKRRPTTAFLLFVADCRDKMMKEHPTLNLQKVTSIARLKWRMLKKQQQAVYHRKLEEINRLYQEREALRTKKHPTSEQGFVKRQFSCQHDEQNQNQSNQDDDGEPRQSNQNTQQQNSQQEAIDTQQMQHTLAATLPKDHQQQAGGTHEPAKEKSAIQNILDLFHSQPHRQPQSNESNDANQWCAGEHEMKEAEHTDGHLPKMADSIPSLVMMEAATGSHPIVIPPTVQE